MSQSSIPYHSLTFIKGVAVLLVILVHIPWTVLPVSFLYPYIMVADQGVQFFLLIQCFIVSFKILDKERFWYSYYNLKSLQTIGGRILVPWFVLAGIENMAGISRENLLSSVLNCGVSGPGSYYLLIYLQCYFLLPFTVRIFGKYNKLVSTEFS